MIILSNGYKLPESPDTGDIFFGAIEFDIQRLNDHSHNGTDSALLSTVSQNILAANWVAAPVGGGVYRQSVTVPTGYSYDTANIWFKLSTGEYVYPSVERITGTTYYVYTNNNALDYLALYR